MIYLLDTNICIYLMRHKTDFSDAVRARFRECNSKDICISVITHAELYYGAVKSAVPEKSRQQIDIFLAPFEIIQFDREDAEEYGRIKGSLGRRGMPIGILDNMIAAQALRRNFTVVTNNIREFARISGLKLENWVD